MTNSPRPLRRGKLLAYRAWRRLGMFDAVSESAWRRSRLAVLCYHGVSLEDEDRWNGFLYVSPELFRRRMEQLARRRCNVLPLAEGLRMLGAGSLPPRSVLITFDDGFYDFGARAWPILREFGFPATVYLSTYYSDFNVPVFPLMCDYLLWKAPAAKVRVVGLDGQPLELWAGGASRRQVMVERILAQADLGQASAADKQRWLESLAEALGVDLGRLSGQRILHLLNPSEVGRLAAEGVDFQLHTHRHRAPRDQALFEREIGDNRRSIRAATGRGADHLCYPSGVWHADFLPWLEGLGVQSAMTSEPGLAGPDSHPLLIPRLLDHQGVTEVEFDAWITGGLDRLRGAIGWGRARNDAAGGGERL